MYDTLHYYGNKQHANHLNGQRNAESKQTTSGNWSTAREQLAGSGNRLTSQPPVPNTSELRRPPTTTQTNIVIVTTKAATISTTRHYNE